MVMQEINIVRVFGQKLLIACSILTLYACNKSEVGVPFYLTPDLSPVWDAENVTPKSHTIASFQFTNQEGEAFGSHQLEGKIYVANFFFTSCPSICPKMTNNLVRVSDAFKNTADVGLVSFSVTPDIDSVATLKRFHDLYELRDHWSLLTGSQDDIYNLARKSYFVEERFGLTLSSNEFLHTERCIIIDKYGHIRGVYNATVALDMDRIIDDINQLLEMDKRN